MQKFKQSHTSTTVLCRFTQRFLETLMRSSVIVSGNPERPGLSLYHSSSVIHFYTGEGVKVSKVRMVALDSTPHLGHSFKSRHWLELPGLRLPIEA